MTKSGSRVSHSFIAILIFVVALAVFALNWPHAASKGYGAMFGGTSTVGTMRVLQGELPYRDFWTIFPPGQFYFLALLFWLLGSHLIVEVVASSLVAAAAVCAAYLLVNRLTNRRALGACAAAVMVGVFVNTGYYLRFDGYQAAILAALAGFHHLLRFFETHAPRSLTMAGVAGGVAALFQDDLGLCTVGAVCAGLIAHFMVPKPDQRPGTARFLGIYLAGVLLVVLPVAAVFSIAAGTSVWENFIVFPQRDWRLPGPKPELYPVWLPKPGATTLDTVDNVTRYIKYTVPFLLNLAGVFAIVLAFRRRNTVLAGMAAALCAAYLFHFGLANIHINTNIITMSTYAAANAAMLYALLSPRNRTLGMAFVLMLVAGWLVAVTGRPAYLLARRYTDRSLVTLNLPRVSGFRVTAEEAKTFGAVSAFISSHVPEGQPLYVGLARHDIMMMSDTFAYFLFNRPIPVRYHELHPAVAPTAAVQKEMIAAIARRQTRYLVTRTTHPDPILDQVKRNYGSRLSDLGATDLDEFIRSQYQLAAEFAPYSVWVSKTYAGRRP